MRGWLPGGWLPGGWLPERDADLRDADLQRADLRGAKLLTQEQLDGACGGNLTLLPEGLSIGFC